MAFHLYKGRMMGSPSVAIKTKALELGFSACGITPAKKLGEEELRLKSYLEKQYHGEMGYMANHFEKRLDPTLLVPGAKSVVVLLMNYFPEKFQKKGVPVISKYAYGKDYHLVVKERLAQLFNFIDQQIAPVQGRIFTDSAPVLERTWAVQAGLGWIGKNGLLINREFGSFVLIGELIVDLELEYDQPYRKEHCGHCTRCLDHCPTRALLSPKILDARRCISYLTIEMKDDTPDEFKSLLMNRVYGCDICQDVCPWNRKLKPHTIGDFMPQPGFLDMDIDDWKQLTETDFIRLFSFSAVKRAGYVKLKRNIGNIAR
ncbi:MAG TPA: tRNA epoxyqueuosine(34) reductase QueG [Prolixibacteraceae bacterium]|nr:tRNA epoxyqueuosine(34) reductase QueG [Prolixibacteraceae bacterium]